MEKTVRQHYVPRFYLRGFSTPQKENALFGYRISEQKLFGPILVDGVAHEKHFYDLDDTTSLEGDLAKLESRIATVHRKILETRDLATLSATELYTYAQFIATQSRRTRRARDDVRFALNLMADSADLPHQTPASQEHIRKTGEGVLRAFEEVLSTALEKALSEVQAATNQSGEAFRAKALQSARHAVDKYREYFAKGQLHPDVQQSMREAAADPTRVKQLHINALSLTAAKAARSLFSMYWYLLRNESEEALITSDNPVISIDGAMPLTEHGHLSALPTALGYTDWHDSSGNLKPSLRVLMPLSPKLMLVIAPTNTLPIQPLDGKRVSDLNAIVATQARDFLFGSTDDFTSAMSGLERKKTLNAALEGIIRIVLSGSREDHKP